MSKFYLTTAIDYPNSLPHIGIAFEKIGADVQARYRRFKGDDVFFLMGNDENTWKVAKRARELGEDPKAYCDRMAGEFKAVWNALDISYDHFIQTTDPQHIRGVQHFISVVNQSGYIEKRKYSGMYCDGCEAFKTDKEIVNGKCPNHKNQDLRWSEEENYFFLFSKLSKRVLSFVSDSAKQGMLAIEPVSRYNEMVKFLANEAEDISISRRNEGWGIPIPWDKSQVVYVWFDALLNYMTGCGLLEHLILEGAPVVRVPGGEPWGMDLWPADVHFVGKDIVRFHCGIWPAMIMAYNEGRAKLAQCGGVGCTGACTAQELPRKVFGHGFINMDGEKIAKSGKFVSPMELVKEFGCDAYRYYFLSRCDYGSDGEYAFDHFVEVYNADLANNLGNLLSRVISMTIKYFDGDVTGEHPEGFLCPYGISVYKDYCSQMEACRYRSVLEAIWSDLRIMNEYIESQKPWAFIKTDRAKTAAVMGNLINGLRAVAIFLKPILPQTSRKIYESFQFEKPWEELSLDYFRTLLYEPGNRLSYNLGVSRDILNQGRPTPLFQRYEAHQ